MPQADVVVVGAGASGLSASAALQRRGIDAVVIERDATLGGTWTRRYERLHLHTVRAHSGLAHYPIPRRAAKYLSRDAYVAYLNEYALHFGLRIVTGQTVQKIHLDARAPDHWKVCCQHDSWQARVVVVASGQYRVPLTPVLPGLQTYGGQFTHSAVYQNGNGYAGKRVLVVGAGNSGAEIVTDLVECGAAFVALSVRSAPPIMPRDPFGTPVQRTSMLLSLLPSRLADRLGQWTARLVLGDLSRHGWPAVDWRPYSSRRVPVIDVGFVSMLKKGRVKIRPALVRLTATDAVYADGRAEPFDAIIMATGYSTGLASLLDAPGTLDACGGPLTRSGEPTASAGLFFIGYTHSLRGHLFEANRDSRKLAGHVERYLQRNA